MTPEHDVCEHPAVEFTWEERHELVVLVDEGSQVVIVGNAAGLKSLAGHLLVLASAEAKPGSHLHFDEFNGLGPDSTEIVLERADG
jgi:hypothetical protein